MAEATVIVNSVLEIFGKVKEDAFLLLSFNSMMESHHCTEDVDTDPGDSLPPSVPLLPGDVAIVVVVDVEFPCAINIFRNFGNLKCQFLFIEIIHTYYNNGP